MSYGVEIVGETTLLGWSDRGEITPWTERQAQDAMLDTMIELRARGVADLPQMRVVLLNERSPAAGS